MLARPILPVRLQTSIVGRNELNYRVRNGNGCTLALISTNCRRVKLRSLRFRLQPTASAKNFVRFVAPPLPREPAYAGLRSDRCHLWSKLRFWLQATPFAGNFARFVAPTAASHPENRTKRKLLTRLCLQNCRLSPRAISTGQLHTLLHFHPRPIKQVVFLCPYSLNG